MASTQQHVVVTGASSGIGRAAVVAIAERGTASVVTLVARRADALDETAELARSAAVDAGATPPDLRVLVADLVDPADRARLVEALRGARPAVSVLVNNAGAGSDDEIDGDRAVAAAARMVALNLDAPIHLTIGLLPSITEAPRGVVVNVSSVAGLVGTPDAPVYSATKWGLTGFTEALRARLADTGTSVVCIQPGPIPTPGWPHAWLDGRPLARRVLAATDRDVALAVERACRTGRPAVRTVPRAYAPIPVVRGLAPWLVRAVLPRVRERGVTTPHGGDR